MTHTLIDFFQPALTLTVDAVAGLTGAERLRGSDLALNGVSAASQPIAATLTFVEQAKLISADLAVAGAVLCAPNLVDKIPAGPVILAHETPQIAFNATVRALYPSCEAGVPLSGELPVSNDFAGARISPSAQLEEGVRIMPGAVVGAGAEIGAGTLIGANCVIADKVRIGRNCAINGNSVIQYALIGDHVSIHPGAMIGQDGFGYVPSGDGLEKVPHVGRVIIQDHVEIGANSSVDRGTIGDTVIGEGCKIDNFVQIAHNVQLGRFVILCGHVGVSGSCTIGDGAMLGGGAGLANGITVGAGAQLAASAGVMHDIPAGERWAGTPAQPLRQFFVEQATLRKLAKAPKKS